MQILTCKCGFKFSSSGEFRNCEAFATNDGRSGVVCPKCGTNYVDGVEYLFVDSDYIAGVGSNNRLQEMPEKYYGQFRNGGCTDPCDMVAGPCACGAWHKLSEWPDEVRREAMAAIQGRAIADNLNAGIKSGDER